MKYNITKIKWTKIIKNHNIYRSCLHHVAANKFDLIYQYNLFAISLITDGMELISIWSDPRRTLLNYRQILTYHAHYHRSTFSCQIFAAHKKLFFKKMAIFQYMDFRCLNRV